MEEMVSFLLQDDIIPDLLAEVLGGIGRDYYYSSEEDEGTVREKKRRIPGFRSKVEVSLETGCNTGNYEPSNPPPPLSPLSVCLLPLPPLSSRERRGV